jgi:hypothetical protein
MTSFSLFAFWLFSSLRVFSLRFVAAGPPACDEGGVFGRCVFPDIVARVDDVQPAAGQPASEELGVDRVRQHVALEAGQGGGDHLPRISVTELFQIGSLDPVLEQSARLKRNRSGAAAHDQAAQPVRIGGRGEQCGRGAGAGPDQMRVIEREGVGSADDELGHRPRR